MGFSSGKVGGTGAQGAAAGIYLAELGRVSVIACGCRMLTRWCWMLTWSCRMLTRWCWMPTFLHAQIVFAPGYGHYGAVDNVASLRNKSLMLYGNTFYTDGVNVTLSFKEGGAL